MVAGEEDQARASAKAGMTKRDSDNRGTAEVRAAQGFDTEALSAWMRTNIPGFAGPLTVRQFKGGQSNPTYQLITPARTYVLRRKPPGKLLPGAHAVDREARVLTALARTNFPVAQVHALCTDDTVIGTWFYVMDMVEGRIFWDATLTDVVRDQRWSFYDAMNAAIADLHRIDPVAVGLGDFGKPGNYLGRQIARWSKQYLDDADAGRDPYLDRLVEWLPAHIPAGDETSIVHGDFRIDNMIFHPTEPRILAVIDWELATLGHPLADFCYHLMTYRLPPLVIAGLADADLAALNIPSEADYVAAYCRRSGRDGIPNLDFYMAYNLFRMAAIIHGIKGRTLRGTAASPNAREMVAALPVFAELGWRQVLRIVSA
jgi:aminoglycoside phosphotransferase (APT) family kinase protein